MSYEIDKRVARLAARLWRLHLGEHDNGDVEQSLFAGVVCAQIPRPSPEQLDAFEAELAQLISAGNVPLLHVDYHGDEELLQACVASGVPELLLPLKSSTNHYARGKVLLAAAFGYAAPWNLYYPLDEAGERWWTTTLGGRQRDEDSLLAWARWAADQPALAGPWPFPGQFVTLGRPDRT